MSTRSVTIARIRGIPIRVDASWTVIAVLVAWSFWARFSDGRQVGIALVMAVVAAALFFVSVLLHELAHALEATHRGLEVRSITLFLFGGATEADLDAERPVDEFALTAVGPASSLVLGAAFGLIAYLTRDVPDLADVAGLLGWTNVALGFFNLLPGAPLDGGRLLASIVWRITHDRLRGAEVAARAGQVLGALLMAAGLVELFFVLGGAAGGVWLAFIGWFLTGAARSELLRTRVQRSLEGLTAGDLLGARADAVPAGVSVGWAIHSHLLAHHAQHFPVRDRDRIVGVIGPDELRAVPPKARATTLVAEAMVPVSQLPKLKAADDAVETLGPVARTGAVVVTGDNGDIAGVITSDWLDAVLRRAARLERVTPR